MKKHNDVDSAEYLRWLETEYKPIAGGAEADEAGEEEYQGAENALEEGAEGEEEGEGDEAAEEHSEGESDEANQIPKPYTTEELEYLLVSEGKIDETKLSPEGKALMKSFQRGYTKKFEALSAEKRQLEEQKKSSELAPKERYFQEFLQEPSRVLAEINKEIEKLEDISSFEDNYEAARKTIRNLQGLKEEFITRKQDLIDTSAKQKANFAAAQAEVASILGDKAQEKLPLLREFTKTEFSLSDEEINFLTNPNITGALAIKLVKGFNKVYDKMNAGKTAAAKQNKTAPKTLARAGTTTIGGEKKTFSKEKSLMEEARKTGDFSKVLEAKGVL